MSAIQLTIFEPTQDEAMRLLQGYMKTARTYCAVADKFELLRMPGAVLRAEAIAADAVQSAMVLACYLDLTQRVSQ